MGLKVMGWIPLDAGQLGETALEVFGECRKLASDVGRVVAFLFGEGAEQCSEEAIAYGVDKAYWAKGERFDVFDLEAQLTLMTYCMQCEEPNLVIIPSTADGAALAPRLSVRSHCGFASNVINTAVQENGDWLIRVEVMAGKANKLLAFRGSESIIQTVRPGTIGAGKKNRKHQGETVAIELADIPADATTVIGHVKADYHTVALQEAERVVAFGSALKSQEDLYLIENLAEGLKAALGGSKPVADKSWIPFSRMIGQSSGRRIKAKLLVGAGISGATHFVEGMKDVGLLVAINKERGAPLMKEADLALVGDMYEVIPAIVEQLFPEERGEGSDDS
jgi:electron transfer flavoprotein alpha subunit